MQPLGGTVSRYIPLVGGASKILEPGAVLGRILTTSTLIISVVCSSSLVTDDDLVDISSISDSFSSMTRSSA